MQLLLLILLKLGFYYTPEQIQYQSNTGNQEIAHAQHIIDNHLYSYDEEGGIIIEDDVDPEN